MKHRRKLKTIFFTGILVITPALVSLLVIYYIFDKIDGILSPIIHRSLALYAPELSIPGPLISIVSVFLIVLIIFIVGLFAGNYIGKKVFSLLDALLSKTPIVKGVYLAVKQFMNAFKISSSERFHKVVALEYPKDGMWVIGFVTSDVGPSKTSVITQNKEPLLNVFIPTTPNPTSGYLVMVSPEKVRELDMTIEQGVKFVVSAGVVQHDRRPDEK
ncbi:MAG: DUF502 domain-containing protein [Acidobacteria bacterium]|nr:DUF502 domain-containing protein [Acidobacteriota bacterium]